VYRVGIHNAFSHTRQEEGRFAAFKLLIQVDEESKQ